MSAAKHDVSYDRTVLVNVLVYHYRASIKGCGCGWAELGRSWAEHVAEVYEQSVAAREGSPMSGGGDSGD
jgi:hypothetical protein